VSTIYVKSPTRIDLAGGTLDMWPLYSFVGGAKTINGAINIWTHVKLTPSLNQEVSFYLKDLNLDQSFLNLEDFFLNANPSFELIKQTLKLFTIPLGFRLETSSESPVGGGLGGSSSLVISILKAFSKWTHQFENLTVNEWALLAHNIEARMLMTPTGTQDYFPPLTGGLSCLNYDDFGVKQISLNPAQWPLSKNGFLVDTGKSHHSGLNNFDVLSRAVKKDSVVLNALKGISEVSEQMYLNFESHNVSELLPIWFEKEYEYRLQLSPSFASHEILKLKAICTEYPKVYLKILGAGGGGCVLIWTQEIKKSVLIERLYQEGFKTLEIDWVLSAHT